MVLWMVFQMSVRDTDVGGDTGGSSDRKCKDLFRADHHRRAVMDGFFSKRSIPAKGPGHRYRQEPVWEERNTSVGMRAGIERRGKACVRRSFSVKISCHGAVFPYPILECRHSIWSMKHRVWGSVSVNGTPFSFDGAQGYWEGDRGRSFPREYIWTQCSFPEGALMLSVADIPIAGFHFRGLIGVVVLDGREYRFGTYLGAKTSEIGNGRVKVVQGRMELEAALLEQTGKPLKAPARGKMVRTDRKSVV